MNEDYRTPGQFIDALLSQRGWTQRLLAIILGVDETGLNHIVSGKRAVSAEMAILLGETFDVQPEKFLALQRDYDLAFPALQKERARLMITPLSLTTLCDPRLNAGFLP